MGSINDKDMVARIIEHANNLGASVAGVANIETLKNSPSHILFDKVGSFDRVKPMDPGDSMFLVANLPTCGALEFNPCSGCDMPCRTYCPRAAFLKKVYHSDEPRLDDLPGRTGVYDRQLCNQQMETDISNCEKIRIPKLDRPEKLINYCRVCEFTCPVGKA